MTGTCLSRFDVELPTGQTFVFLRGGSSRDAGGERREVQGTSSYYDGIPCCSIVSAECRREEGRKGNYIQYSTKGHIKAG